MKHWQKTRIYDALSVGRNRDAVTMAAKYSRGTVATSNADGRRRWYRWQPIADRDALVLIKIDKPDLSEPERCFRKAKAADLAGLEWLTWEDDSKSSHWSFDNHADQHQRRWNRKLKSSAPKPPTSQKPLSETLLPRDKAVLAELLGMTVEQYEQVLREKENS